MSFEYKLSITNTCSKCSAVNTYDIKFGKLYTTFHPKGLGSNGCYDIEHTHEVKLECKTCKNKDNIKLYT